MRGREVVAACVCALAFSCERLQAEAPVAPEEHTPPRLESITVATLDGLIAREAPAATAAAPLSDEQFLRRASFDLIGRQPTVAEQAQFAADRSPAKRRDLVDRLLASDEFGANWADYWSDTIAYRVPPPELTYLDYRPLKAWLAAGLNAGATWDEIVWALITAQGKIAEVPAATFVGYHQANATNLAGETSRIFLGQQILCAQCHDHPFDHWKRTEFHALAAFYARVKAKLPWNDGPGTLVSAVEKGEHVMPDMDDPSKPGNKMKPAFLVHDDADPRIGKDDAQRRTRLAEWVTSRDNPWFAKAYTNRIWSRLLGRGFYEPVDDLGDSQTPLWPAVHAALAGHFAATGYDIKDLFRLIMHSEAYARGLRLTADGGTSAPAAEPLRMRGDEVFAALSFGLSLPNFTPPAVAPTNEVRFPPPPASTRDLVNTAFGTDPSLSPLDAPRTMAQALWMMNNEQLQKQINAAPGSGTLLSKLLDEFADDTIACEQLYARLLARKPTDAEHEIARAHVAKLGDRRAAFEDLLWSLVNSAEFTTRK
ncbi:MAG: DUF1549 domain-containing protein [Pirellulales bacterium]